MSKKKLVEVSLAGDLGIRNAGELKQRLLDALSGAASIRIVARELTSIDTAALQLLIASRKSAEAAAIPVSVDAPADGVLAGALSRLGFAAASPQARASKPFAVLEASQTGAAR